MITETKVNAQVGDYVAVTVEATRETGGCSLGVRMVGAGPDGFLSFHQNLDDCLRRIKIYRAADARRARQ